MAKRAKRGRKRTAKKAKSTGKRALLRTGRDTRYARRGKGGRWTEMDDVGRSLASDRRKKAKRKVKSGYGDRGDR